MPHEPARATETPGEAAGGVLDSPWLTTALAAARARVHVHTGHSTLAITVDTYSREADEARKRAAGYMDRVTRRKSSENR